MIRISRLDYIKLIICRPHRRSGPRPPGRRVHGYFEIVQTKIDFSSVCISFVTLCHNVTKGMYIRTVERSILVCTMSK